MFACYYVIIIRFSFNLKNFGRCDLSIYRCSDLFLFGEDLDIFLDFMDDDEEIQGIFDEKVDEVRSDEFFVQLEIQQL